MTTPIEKHHKTFTEYYNDPVYREHHMKYMKTIVQCDICGDYYMRCNKFNHDKILKHRELVNGGAITKAQEITTLKNEIEKLKYIINELQLKK